MFLLAVSTDDSDIGALQNLTDTPVPVVERCLAYY